MIVSVIVKIIFFKDENLFKKLTSFFIVFIPVNALEESSFVIIRESIKENFGEEKFFKIKEIFEKEKIDEFLKRIMALNYLANIWNVVDINFEIFEIAKEIMQKYRLLPNDALIAATCKYYGIKRIATFDEDFERVEFLEVLKI